MKKTFSRLGSKAMVFCLGASAFLAAAPVQTLAADQMYTITYRPGRIGAFSSELEQRYQTFAEENGGSVTVSDKTGNIKLELPAGTEYPAAPRQDEILLKEEYEGKYVISTDWMPQTGQTVTESENYVVDYEALVDGVTYRVEFVDAESGQQVAAPIIAQGNVDQWITYAAAQRLDTYVLDAGQPDGIRLTKDGDNTLTFTYTDSNVTVVETPGDVVTEEVTVPGDQVTVTENVPGTTAGTGGQTQTAGTGTAAGNDAQTDADQETAQGQTAGQDQTTIEEEDVPLAQNPAGDTEEPEDGTTEIEDEEVPQADTSLKEDSGVNPGALFGVTAGVVAAAAAVAVVIIRKKRSGM